MKNSQISEMFPIEVTTHNLYFHEEASIFSIHAFLDLIATGGGDGVVRLWKLVDEGITIEGDYQYTTALNSTSKFKYLSDVVDHKKAVNCVRFSNQGILASASDNGRVILHEKEQNFVLREADGLDCYELMWAKDKLFIGLSNGCIEEYNIDLLNFKSSKLYKSINIHSDIVQGLSYNEKHDLVLSISKDNTAKITLDGVCLESFSLNPIEKSFYRRGCFSQCKDLAFLCNSKNNTVLVVSYPFTEFHWVCQLGPFNSEVVKIVDNEFYVFILCRTSLYIYKEFNLLGCIDNLCFKSVTDAVIIDKLLLVSSLDGFISSFKWN